MGSIVDQLIASGPDDGFEDENFPIAFDNTSGTVNPQSHTNPAFRRNVFTRFGSVAIPPGSTLLTASIVMVGVSGGGTTYTLSAHDVDDSPAPSAGFTSLPKTSATVGANWTGTTPDLSAIIQEIIDRPGWANENAITFIWISSSVQTIGSTAAAFENPTFVAGKLSATWTDPPTPDSSRQLLNSRRGGHVGLRVA